MSYALQIRLASSHTGRIILHLAALRIDWKFRWHYQGIKREFKTA